MEQVLNDDTVRRLDAIKAIESDLDEIDALDPSAGIMKACIRRAMWKLMGVPSADRWIPCSERMPTKAGHYLCSFKKPKCIDNIHVELAYWTGGRWYGYLASEINAWMPLPEPWKGADDER